MRTLALLLLAAGAAAPLAARQDEAPAPNLAPNPAPEPAADAAPEEPLAGSEEYAAAALAHLASVVREAQAQEPEESEVRELEEALEMQRAELEAVRRELESAYRQAENELRSAEHERRGAEEEIARAREHAERAQAQQEEQLQRALERMERSREQREEQVARELEQREGHFQRALERQEEETQRAMEHREQELARVMERLEREVAQRRGELEEQFDSQRADLECALVEAEQAYSRAMNDRDGASLRARGRAVAPSRRRFVVERDECDCDCQAHAAPSSESARRLLYLDELSRARAIAPPARLRAAGPGGAVEIVVDGDRVRVNGVEHRLERPACSGRVRLSIDGEGRIDVGGPHVAPPAAPAAPAVPTPPCCEEPAVAPSPGRGVSGLFVDPRGVHVLELPELDFTLPEIAELDWTEADLTVPEIAELDWTEADLTVPDVAELDWTEADLTVPDVGAPLLDLLEPDVEPLEALELAGLTVPTLAASAPDPAEELGALVRETLAELRGLRAVVADLRREVDRIASETDPDAY